MNDNRTGMITKGVGGVYTVFDTDTREYVSCAARGGLRKGGNCPTVGDNVEFGPTGDPDIPFILERILPRKNRLIRPPLANVSNMLLTFAVSDPVPDLKLLDKMLIVCSIKQIRPVIIFTKADLDPVGAEKLLRIYSDAGYDCVVSSADAMPGISYLTGLSLSGITGFAGPSGVGKSTLCNHLIGDDFMKVGEVSDRLKRGKHTTRHVELLEFGDGFMSDTPGFTSLDLFEIGVDHEQVILGYPEMEKIASGCRYDDCRHISETDCSVRNAVGVTIDTGRYDRYREFYEELYMRRNDYNGRKRS